MKTRLIGPRQTLTARATPDGASTVDLTGLPATAAIQIAFEPGRARDVVLTSCDGGELLIPGAAGGDGHYSTTALLPVHGPYTLSASEDTEVTLSLLRVDR